MNILQSSTSIKQTKLFNSINKIHYTLSMFTALLISTIIITNIVNAKPVVGFQAGHIIDDLVFINKDSMTVDQIQAFLNSKVPVCDNWGTNGTTSTSRRDYVLSHGYTLPMTCLKDYQENGLSTAQIIYNAAQNYKINPQVLIVLLQKEQGLVTDDWPTDNQYRSATGYGCPDTAPCDSQYYGLTNQINWSAHMFRAIFNSSPTWYTPYILGANYVQYSTNSSCGGSIINIENKATQSLYNYTPYQPNQAALNAGYSTGDACSAYGNRNFYQYFTDWFGSTRVDDTINAHPDGSLISMNSRVYLVDSGALHYISNASVFESYSYRWQDIKTATTGDKLLAVSDSIDYMKPGVLYTSPGENVYVTVDENGNKVKKIISYDSFINLKYSWSQVRYTPASEMPATTSESIYFADAHPEGTLIKNQNGVFVINNSSRRYVSPAVFESYKWRWSDIVTESPGDTNIPIGDNMTLREGSIISDGSGLYVIEISSTNAEIKHPIGPWECYANIYKYNLTDVIMLFTSASPTQNGARVSC